MTRRLSLIGLLPLTITCSTGGEAPGGEWDAALSDLVATERAFARLASDSTVQIAFVTYVAESSLLFRPGPVDGRSWLERNPMPADVRLEWAPAWADVSADGRLGYTTGPWQAGQRAEPGETSGFGQYVTLWQRTDSEFRAVLDYGVSHGQAPLMVPLETATRPAEGVAYDADGESLAIADEDLADAISSAGAAAWQPYAHDRIRWLRNGSPPVTGGATPPAGPSEGRFLSLGARLAGSGDLGYSWGEYRAAADDAQAAGHYVRIWRRQQDGSWKVVLDALGG